MTQPSIPNYTRKVDWALCLAHAGFTVIPVQADTKTPVAKWVIWESDQSDEHIQKHWNKFPHHDIGIITNEDLIVFDADSDESLNTLLDLEKKYGIESALVVKTRKGMHHYYLRPKNVFASQDSFNTKLNPEKIDIKTGRSLVIGPGSANKTIQSWNANHRNQLSPVSQEFVDAVFKSNQRDMPRASPKDIHSDFDGAFSDCSTSYLVLRELVKHCDPNDYGVWIRIGTALHHETGGSLEGMAMFDDWSKRGKTYKGIREIEYKWKSFRQNIGHPSTIGTLVHYAKQAGANVAEILSGGSEEFSPCETLVIYPKDETHAISTVADSSPNPIKDYVELSPLEKFSLRDKLPEIESLAQTQVPIMGGLMVYGQASVIYGEPNTGKTIITLHLLIEDIKAGLFVASNLYYLNMDDNSNGLIEKLRIAQEYGFHMLADGHQDFSDKVFREVLGVMVESGAAKGVIVVLDTLTKFVNTMDKLACRSFAKLVRQFVLKGGTVIALAHTNKNPGADGKPVYAGVTDIVNDFDCVYILSTVTKQADSNQKVVEFINRKRRGSNLFSESFSYALERSISYEGLLMSVQKVYPNTVSELKAKQELISDGQVIQTVKNCISEGVTTKMNLVMEVAKLSSISRRYALTVIEKYTGNDVAKHHWNFTVKERGAKDYALIVRSQDKS